MGRPSGYVKVVGTRSGDVEASGLDLSLVQSASSFIRSFKKIVGEQSDHSERRRANEISRKE